MKLSAAMALAVLLLTVCAAIGQSDARVSATWQVVRYDISATLPAAESDRSLAAKATVQVRNVTDRPATSLTFRISPNADVTSVKINDGPVEPTRSQEKIGSANLQRIAVRLAAVPPGGDVRAEFEYKLSVADNSGLNTISPVAAQFLPLSYWYPTPNSWFFARGADHAPYRIQISAPNSLTVLAAGTEGDGAFDNKVNGQPFFVAGSWDKFEISGVSVFLPKGAGSDAQKRASELAGLVVEARSFAAGMLGNAPDVPLRLIAVRRGSGYAGGGTFLVDEGVFRRSKIDSLTLMAVAESVVRTWLGEKALIADDGGGVIREGLSRYIATQFIETKFGRDMADVERVRQRTAYAAVSRRDAPLIMAAPLDDYYFPAVANKGAMFWRLLERKAGREETYKVIRAAVESGRMSMPEIRRSFPTQKLFVDSMLDELTDLNLLAGIPQVSAGEARVALRNTGGFDVTVNVEATLDNGEKLSAPSTIRAKSFGEIIFRTQRRVIKVEIDPEKLYPQIDYSDDIAPRETTDSDPLLAVKRDFDRQNYAEAEKTARIVLRAYPRYDDVRVLLGRSLLAQNKMTEAETEFRDVLAEKLPTARSLAWANVGIAEVASRTGRNADALKAADDAIRAEAEYGAGLSARAVRNRISGSTAVDESIKGFFAQFDRAAISNRKAELEALVVPGEVNRFVSGISGQATEWRSQPIHADQFDANSVLVEVNISARLLTREPESGNAVLRLVRSGSGWKLTGVEMFEVR